MAGATQLNPINTGLDRIDQRQLPLDFAYTYFFDGTGVHVYVLDGGLRATHQEFTGRVGAGADFVGDGLGTGDCGAGHGTAVTGVLAGATLGVARGATIHPVRISDCSGNATVAATVSGMNWVAAGALYPAVASISTWWTNGSSAVDAASNGLIDAGVLLVALAGNDNGSDACNTSPGRVARVVTVGATFANDSVASYSNIGSCLDLFAYGSATTAGIASDTATVASGGTSIAAPYVSGVAALLLQAAPLARWSDIAGFITANATPGIVTGSIGSSPNRFLHSRWTSRWVWAGAENCYDLFGGSCYTHYWYPACPSRPVSNKGCVAGAHNCWSVASASWVEEYACIDPN